MSYFSELGLSEPLVRALDDRGYEEPSPIQRQAIPALLTGRDLLGIAQTGTGKTAAFSLPSLHRMLADPQPRRNAACRMLVLSPTRELAAQIADNMRHYAKFTGLTVQAIFGGVPAGKQARALARGCDVLVATPGRLLDLIDQRALTLRHVEIFVLDEADQMMDLGFIVPLKRVSALLPKPRQSLFFSATMPKAIAELGRQFIHDPVRVEVTPQATTAERVEQYVTFINQAEKQALLTLRLRAGLGDGSIDRALVFTRTKHGADRVVRHLSAAHVQCAAIHGNKSQAQRTAALTGFRKGDVRVLVATDIAARGIDVSGVSHVFNFEMPNVPEQYVHRIGRTARAGADGVAVSYVAPDEKPYLRDIEKLTGVRLDPEALPEDFLKEAARLPAPSRHQPAAAAPTRQGRDQQRQARPAGGRGRDERSDRGERRDRPERGNRFERNAQGERTERRDRPERAERAERGPRQDRSHNAERGQRSERQPHAERNDRGERRERAERPAHTGHAERRDHGERHDRGERQERGEQARGPRRFGGGNRNGVGAHAGKVRRAS